MESSALPTAESLCCEAVVGTAGAAWLGWALRAAFGASTATVDVGVLEEGSTVVVLEVLLSATGNVASGTDPIGLSVVTMVVSAAVDASVVVVSPAGMVARGASPLGFGGTTGIGASGVSPLGFAGAGANGASGASPLGLMGARVVEVVVVVVDASAGASLCSSFGFSAS